MWTSTTICLPLSTVYFISSCCSNQPAPGKPWQLTKSEGKWFEGPSVSRITSFHPYSVYFEMSNDANIDLQNRRGRRERCLGQIIHDWQQRLEQPGNLPLRLFSCAAFPSALYFGIMCAPGGLEVRSTKLNCFSTSLSNPWPWISGVSDVSYFHGDLVHILEFFFSLPAIAVTEHGIECPFQKSGIGHVNHVLCPIEQWKCNSVLGMLDWE